MKLTATKREIFGKQSKQLRNQGFVPAIIYGKHVDSNLHVMVKKNEFIKTYRQTGSSQVINLEGDVKQMVLVHTFQKNPITDDVIHIDFLAVNANEVVSADVAVVLTGVAPVEKDGIGRIELAKDSVKVQALPKDLPRQIELDISAIATLDDGIFVRDLSLGSKIEVLDDADLILVAAVPLADESAEEATVETGAEEATAE